MGTDISTYILLLTELIMRQVKDGSVRNQIQVEK
jgi:hypothetical protein